MLKEMLFLIFIGSYAFSAGANVDLKTASVAMADQIELVYRQGLAVAAPEYQASTRQIALQVHQALQNASRVERPPEFVPPPPLSATLLKLFSAGAGLSAVLAFTNKHDHREMAIALVPAAIASYALSYWLSKPPKKPVVPPAYDQTQLKRSSNAFVEWVARELIRRGIPTSIESNGACQAYLYGAPFVRIVRLDQIQFFENLVLSGRR